jgi:hypothetical protein
MGSKREAGHAFLAVTSLLVGCSGLLEGTPPPSPGGFADRLCMRGVTAKAGRKDEARGLSVQPGRASKMIADRSFAPAGPARAGAFFPSRRGPRPDEAIAVAEKRGVYQVALVAGSHRRGVVARSAPAFDVEGRPSLEQLGTCPSPIIFGGEGRRHRCRPRGGEGENAAGNESCARLFHGGAAWGTSNAAQNRRSPP